MESQKAQGNEALREALIKRFKVLEKESEPAYTTSESFLLYTQCMISIADLLRRFDGR